MPTTAATFLPDGQYVGVPRAPRTWVDAAPGVLGDGLRAPLVTADASAGVLWHRQRPLFQAIQTGGSQSIATATWTPITGLAEIIDNYSGHSDTTNTGRYYPPATWSNTTSGDWYLCTGYIPWNTSDAATPYLTGLRVTGSATVNECGKVPSGAGHTVNGMAIDLLQMTGVNGADYVELVGRQTSGVAVGTVVSPRSASLNVRWVAADQAWTGAFTPALPASPHVWTDADIWAGSATGGGKVPANTEVRDLIRFLHNPPIARVTSVTSTQIIPTGGTTWTSIAFPTETVDNYNGHDNVTNNTRYTCQRAGLYFVAGLVSTGDPGTNSGYRAVRLLQTFQAGGTQTYAGWSCLPPTGGTSGTAIYAVGLLRMAVGDYVETQMQHTQVGANLTVNTAANNCARMIAVWMAK